MIVTMTEIGRPPKIQGLTIQATAGQSVYNLPAALTIFGGGRAPCP